MDLDPATRQRSTAPGRERIRVGVCGGLMVGVGWWWTSWRLLFLETPTWLLLAMPTLASNNPTGSASDGAHNRVSGPCGFARSAKGPAMVQKHCDRIPTPSQPMGPARVQRPFDRIECSIHFHIRSRVAAGRMLPRRGGAANSSYSTTQDVVFKVDDTEVFTLSKTLFQGVPASCRR